MNFSFARDILNQVNQEVVCIIFVYLTLLMIKIECKKNMIL